MSDAEIKLTPAEMTALNELYRKNIRSALMTLIGIAVFLFIFSLYRPGFSICFPGIEPTIVTMNTNVRYFNRWDGGIWLIVYLSLMH